MKKIFEVGDKVAITGAFFPEYRDERERCKVGNFTEAEV